MRNNKGKSMDAEALYELEISEATPRFPPFWRRLGRTVSYLGAAVLCYFGVVAVIAVIAMMTKP